MCSNNGRACTGSHQYAAGVPYSAGVGFQVCRSMRNISSHIVGTAEAHRQQTAHRSRTEQAAIAPTHGTGVYSPHIHTSASPHVPDISRSHSKPQHPEVPPKGSVSEEPCGSTAHSTQHAAWHTHNMVCCWCRPQEGSPTLSLICVRAHTAAAVWHIPMHKRAHSLQ